MKLFYRLVSILLVFAQLAVLFFSVLYAIDEAPIAILGGLLIIFILYRFQKHFEGKAKYGPEHWEKLREIDRIAR